MTSTDVRNRVGAATAGEPAVTGPASTAARKPRRLRPTLRLRLTLLNGLLLIGVGALLVGAAWLSIRDAFTPSPSLRPGSQVVLADGRVLDADTYLQWVGDETATEVLIDGLLALVVVGGVGVVGAYLVAGRALRPLQQVTATARRLSTENLEERISYAGPDDEIRELADTFDEMMDRIAAAFDSQRRFVANASHELRTPLAVMRTEIDVTLADPDADIEELRRMAQVVRDASERANALVESLLLLARSQVQASHGLARRRPVDLAHVVPGAVSAVSEDVQRLTLCVETHLQPAVVNGDPGLLERLVGNLVENAVRHNHQQGWVRIATGQDNGYAWLQVSNTGPVIDEADVPGLFEPFRRGGWERTGSRGAGLGLSIVRAVVDAHGGTVTAVPRPDSGGLDVTARLPAA